VKKLVLFLFPLLSSIAIQAQITVHVRNGEGKKLYLQTFSLSGFLKTDSATVSGNVVTFPLTDRTPPGMYMISDGKDGFEFILNEPEIFFETVWRHLNDSLEIARSVENKLLELYRGKRDKSYLHLDLLNQVLVYYDPETEYYKATEKEFTGMQQRFIAWSDSVIRANPTAYVSRYIRSDRKPSIPLGLKLNEQKDFFRRHWFDGIDWMDNTLMTSDVLTSKITSYLGLYSNPNIGKAELSQGFMIAVDHILPLARQNPAVYNFALKYLIRGFERFGFEDVILHIATNYTPTEQCENEQQSETLARLEKYKLLTVGKQAPDIRMQDTEGRECILSVIKSRKLLVFWATWCPHCQQLLPQIIDWSKQTENSGVRVIPISLDQDSGALKKAISDLGIPWPVLCDYKKWSSRAAVDYNIYATPTMILLDKENKILAKPMNLSELMQAAVN